MIGDVLYEALADIEEYQELFPGTYQETKAEIEEVRQAMTRLLIRLDSPPDLMPERWIDGMVRLGESDPARLKEFVKSRVYYIRRDQVIEALGPDHPMVIRLMEAEEADMDREAELAEALDAYTDPTHPEYDPEFDKKIRRLRPDWFDGKKRE